MQLVTTENQLNEIIEKDTKPVVVKFYGYDCKACTVIEPIIEELENNYKNQATFIKINAHDSSDIASKYSIYSVPQVLVFKNGKVAAYAMGQQKVEKYEDMIESNLH